MIYLVAPGDAFVHRYHLPRHWTRLWQLSAALACRPWHLTSTADMRHRLVGLISQWVTSEDLPALNLIEVVIINDESFDSLAASCTAAGWLLAAATLCRSPSSYMAAGSAWRGGSSWREWCCWLWRGGVGSRFGVGSSCFGIALSPLGWGFCLLMISASGSGWPSSSNFLRSSSISSFSLWRSRASASASFSRSFILRLNAVDLKHKL